MTPSTADRPDTDRLDADHVLAIDQGTTSTRAVILDREARIVGSSQREHRQIFPRPGWVEHDPREIWRSTRRVISEAMVDADVDADQLAGIGITNQRETTVVWDRATGEPVHHAIVWQDTRTQHLCERLGGAEGPDRYRDRTGLPLNTYFAGPKLVWILENVDGARERAEAGELLFGTMDTWLVWNLTGGVRGGLHLTDVTNASRTLLMDLETLSWDEGICADLGIPVSMLPEIRSSAEVYGTARPGGPLSGVPIAGILGDQQAATFGQACFEPGMVKATYGTGSFILVNTGTEAVRSEQGLLTTVCYRIGDEAPVYALEGSIAVTGSLVQWLRDNLGLISSSAEIEELAASVDDNGGAYVVPAFSGLFAPWWRADARGAIVGLTRYVHRGHLARAVLESAAFQTADVVEAMNAEADAPIAEVRVDGGMSVNDTLMQFQADVLGVDVVRPEVVETTAMGAAFAAGIAVGLWDGPGEVVRRWRENRRFTAAMAEEDRARSRRLWRKAVERTFDWLDEDVEAATGG